MKCPKCGDVHLKYKVSRSKKWKGKAGDSARSGSVEPRKNFEVEKCKKCGFEGEVK